MENQQSYIATLPKEVPTLPDAYGVQLFYKTGKSDSFEIVRHAWDKPQGYLEFTTVESRTNWVFLNVPGIEVVRVEFDARLDQILELKAQQAQESSHES